MLYQISPITNPVITGFANKRPEDAPEVFAKFFSALIGLLLTVATIWMFVQLLQAGIEWISSGGDKGKLEAAQGRITSALIGIFIVFASWVIYLIILQFLGLSPIGSTSIQFKIPTLF